MRSSNDPSQIGLPLQVPEGCHLRMPQHVWDSCRAIGAEDLRRLYWDPASWWASTEHNPHRRAPARATRRAGQDIEAALATLVLQGEDAYTARFTVEPDDGSSRYGRKRDEIRKLLAEKGIRIPHGDFTDKTLHGLVRKHGLAHRVFDVARQDYEIARRKGLGHLSEDEDRRVRALARLLTGHKDVGPVFQGGLSEVAVLWRREDDPKTLLRARFRKLRRKRTYELVAMSNWQGRDTDAAVAQTIKDNDLEIQRRLQPEAFAALVRFVQEQKVHAWDPDGRAAHMLADEREALEHIAAGGQPEWVWLFVQLPSDEIGRERGTVVAPRFHQPHGRLWDAGEAKITAALEAYRKYRDSFSLDRPWVLVEDLKELVDTDVSPRTKKETA